MSKAKRTEALAPDTVVQRYTGNGTGGGLPGVPLADITLAQWEQIPIWLRPSITAHADYTKAVDGSLEGEEHPTDPAKPAPTTESQPTDQPA